jgi:hypothetical protein
LNPAIVKAVFKVEWQDERARLANMLATLLPDYAQGNMGSAYSGLRGGLFISGIHGIAWIGLRPQKTMNAGW